MMIKELDFSYNRITNLNQIGTNIPTIFDKMKSQQTYVHMHHNPYICSECGDIDGLINYVRYNGRYLDDNEYYCLKCNEPSILNGLDIRKINITDNQSCNQILEPVVLYNSVVF